MNQVATRQTKPCPFCAEDILVSAIKCKHCRSDLESPPARSTPARAQSPAAADYGLLLISLPVIGTLLVWFWIGSMSLFQSPGSSLMMVGVVTVLGTGLLAALEAQKAPPRPKVKAKSFQVSGDYSPMQWFAVITLLWVIGYPMYLFQRRSFGLKSLGGVGLLVTVMFTGSFWVMNSAIEDRVGEVRGRLENVQQQLRGLGQ